MVELPEALLLARQMNEEIKGKIISNVDIANYKPTTFYLNFTPAELKQKTMKSSISSVYCKGKWIFLELDSGQIFATAPEMGGDILFHQNALSVPENYHFKFEFQDETFLTLKYHGFIFARLGSIDDLERAKYPGKIGPTPLDNDFSFEDFSRMLSESNKMVKAVLLEHQNLPGVANFYLNNAFFKAKLHPKRKARSLSMNEQKSLFDSIKNILQSAVDLKGRIERKDIFGVKGKYERIINSKSVGKTCPNCSAKIEKINVSGSSNYICSECQKLE